MSKPGKNQGEKNFRSRLKEADVLAIYGCTDQTEHELAEKYGVSQPAINHIRTGRTWAWLTGAQKK